MDRVGNCIGKQGICVCYKEGNVVYFYLGCWEVLGRVVFSKIVVVVFRFGVLVGINGDYVLIYLMNLVGQKKGKLGIYLEKFLFRIVGSRCQFCLFL